MMNEMNYFEYKIKTNCMHLRNDPARGERLPERSLVTMEPRYHLATVVLYHVIVVSLLVDRGVLLTKLAGMGITKSSWKCRPQNSRFFLSKSVKKSVKRGVRVLRARSALASHSLVPDLLFDCRAYFNRQKYRLFCSLLEMDTGLPIKQNTAV